MWQGAERALLGHTAEFCNEGGGAAVEITDLLAEDFAILVNEDECGEALDIILLLELVVLVLDVLRELLGLRKIDEHEDEVLAGVILERRGIEDFVVHLDAPWAPVRAGEVQEDVLVVGLRLVKGVGVIGEPAAFIGAGADAAEEKDGGERKAGTKKGGFHKGTDNESTESILLFRDVSNR